MPFLACNCALILAAAIAVDKGDRISNQERQRMRSMHETYRLPQPDLQENPCQSHFQQDYGVHGLVDSECEWTPIVCHMGIASGGRIGSAGAQVRSGQSESALPGDLHQP
jgi:hypothetical protein